jgi:trimeric autotransporter adhesin
MSTKTTFKRIALATVAVMGFGLLSVAPASATIANTSATTTVGTPVRTSQGVFTVPVSVAMVGANYVAGAWTVALTGSTYSQGGSNDPKLAAGAVTSTVNSATSATLTFDVTVTATSDGSTGLNGTNSVVLADVAALAGTYGLVVVATRTDSATAASVPFTISAASVTAGTLVAPVAASGSTRSALVQQVNGQATVNFVDGTDDVSFSVTTSGVGTIVSATATTTAPANLNGTTPAGGVSWTPVTTVQNLAIVTSSTVPGVQTINIQPIGANGVPGTPITATITWGSALAVSTQYSAVRIGAGTTGNGTAITAASASDATVATTVSSAVANAQRFTIRASSFDQNNVALSVASFGASITGPGLISIENDDSSTAVGNGRSVATTTASNTATVAVWSDGSAGVSTITITATTAAGVTTTLGTKTVTFVGAPASITVTQNLFIARAGQALGLVTPTTSRVAATAGAITTTPAIRASVLDAAGNPVAAGSTVRIISSNDAVIVPGACAEYTTTGTAGLAVPAPGRFECVVSGAVAAASGSTATITFQVQNAVTGLWSLSATPITFAIGGTIASVALATNATSYAPGEAMTMTATAKDSAGNAAADGLAPYASISTNMTVVGAPATTAIIVNGVHTTDTSTGTKTMFAPSSVGNLVVSGLTTNASTGTAYSVALKIANEELDSALAAAADAAAEATDAANAATDAANAAAEAADAATAAAQDAADAVAALSTSVTAMVDSLRKQITSLTNLVIKIQRKVRA